MNLSNQQMRSGNDIGEKSATSVASAPHSTGMVTGAEEPSSLESDNSRHASRMLPARSKRAENEGDSELNNLVAAAEKPRDDKKNKGVHSY